MNTASWRTGTLALFGLLLAACGGGGGGSSPAPAPAPAPAPPPTVTFTADRPAFAFSFLEGSPSAAPEPITITATGTLPGTLYVGVTIEGQGLSPNVQLGVLNNQGTFLFLPAPALAPGDYTGRVLLKACSDPACAQQIGNSPLSVSYLVRVRAILKASPVRGVMTAISGAGTSQTFTIQLPDGAATSNATVIGGTDWLSIANATATGFTAQARSLPSGHYGGTIQISAGTSRLDVPVGYDVTPPPGGDREMSALPASLTLATVESAQSAAAVLTFTPPSWDPNVTVTVNHAAGAPAPWLVMSSVAGGFQVKANALDLTAGSYTAEIVFGAAWPANPRTITVPVALTVGIGLVRPADEIVTLNAETPSSALNRSTPINVVAGPGTGWTAASNVDWLAITNPGSSGQSGSPLTYTLDAAKIGALANDAAHVATITVTPARTTMSPVSFKVTIEKRLPRVTSVGPYVHLTAQPVRVILRGSGFDSVGDLLARVAITDASVTSVDRVNDTELVVHTGPMSVGAFAVKVSNALGMAVAQSSITVVAPQTFVATSIPTGGILRSLSFDAERGAIYGANETQQTMMRFRVMPGGNWITNSLPHADEHYGGVGDVGISNDGTKLIASTSYPFEHTGSVSVLDIDTLETISTTPLQGRLEPTFGGRGFGIKTTNDGRSWLAVENVFGPTTFRADTLAVTRVLVPNPDATFEAGPWYAMSRDGERLLMVQTIQVTPDAPPMLYMDAADAVVKATPSAAGLIRTLRFSVDEDGDRVLVDAPAPSSPFAVFDRDFVLVGRTVLPSTPPLYYGYAGQLSLDGRRVYVLAYRDDYTAPGVMPRVFVFDSSAVSAAPDQSLPAVGYFDLVAYPTCVPTSPNDSTCQIPASDVVASTISLDSSTLFFAGSENLVVAPIPAEHMLTPFGATIPITSGQVVPWRATGN